MKFKSGSRPSWNMLAGLTLVVLAAGVAWIAAQCWRDNQEAPSAPTVTLVPVPADPWLAIR
jgi:hypothetical protein